MSGSATSRRELVALLERELDAALDRLASRNGTPAPVEVSSRPDTPPPTVELCSRCGNEPRLADRTIGRA